MQLNESSLHTRWKDAGIFDKPKEIPGHSQSSQGLQMRLAAGFQELENLGDRLPLGLKPKNMHFFLDC